MKNGRYEKSGQVSWYKDDVIHREDGPAIEYHYGRKEWYVNGERHRFDGPAVELPYGYKEWYVNGKLHRLDGPAYEGVDGLKAWYIDGQKVNIIAIFGHEPTVPLSKEEQMILRLSV